ncbi:MAG: hypothetical protein IID44_25710 [Planctomycetes bacterium]|nr:hypothetical protein [Planctomycetota bacterium]
MAPALCRLRPVAGDGAPHQCLIAGETFQHLPVDDPATIDKAAVQHFKRQLHTHRTKQGRKLSVRTKNHRLTVFRSLLCYLIQKEEQHVFPPDDVRLLKEDPRKIEVL